MSLQFSSAIRKLVASRADFRCEYCRKPEIVANFSFHIEHIISRQHGGTDRLSNLAFACSWCNWKKGPNIATVLFEEGDLLPLFNPRTQNWNDHFFVEEGVILGRTDIARGTIRLLELNTTELILERKELMEAGYF
ncbi:MAG: HNH endonuclease [Lewinellaceae bacterium]|nr:HNH endonuclease [Lewinella sp.]MCB9277899.1 HNH endonuclease [Lewinellaceae bacterium]